VLDTSGIGTYYGYIAGQQYEGQSGYDDFVEIWEGGEWTSLLSSCTGWSGHANYDNWQRYYSTVGAWTTPSSGTRTQQCWGVSLVSGGSFVVNH
jgi:hypothetical protein